ncbi:chemotaxis-specific protein-glutamate methyltransferase CheB [Oscillatoria sp. CS-180]|uniref:chemotaxis-specific protein-glutamate methyltransferase CheB n=1 Tax=Oscillatoria sp. CS-180 TaxID=3021720 RepID=UPI00232EFFBE|nr:chemotaxis-specific protein-glutamate methyltransferase CheB [Oscillatoria sp. CS-180]MDB9528302.1 chemotaxis-specific protein-glutamate methyltransferase CheB [Oscillatoria sp. CS-180]
MAIRVLLVEDSLVALTILKRIFDSTPDIEIVGTARTGIEALELIPKVHPEVICTDFHMPQMNGLEFISYVMAHHPLPILVVSASVQEEDTHRIFQLLAAGAVDILPKPRVGLDLENILLRQALIDKVRILSGVKVFKKKQSANLNQSNSLKNSRTPALVSARCRPKIVAVGASTGGPLALQEFLTYLPDDFPLPIICVQHISLGFLQSLIDWLSTSCKLPVQIAEAGERPRSGHVYFPAERQHLQINLQGKFTHSLDPPLGGHRPSVTTTFISIAEFYGRKAIGVLLTGMGRDGAEGMKAIAQAGGMTLAQDEATSVVFGMPKEAIALGAAEHVLPIQAIAPTVLELVNNPSPTAGK